MLHSFTQTAVDARRVRQEADSTDETALVRVLDDALEYSRQRDYAGPDYADGMSSRILRALPVDNKWLNLAVQETIKRAPVNVRPLFLVEERRNYKGAALFAMANHNRHRLDSRYPTEESPVLSEAESLVEWLIENRSRGYSGFCGGHNHRLQHLDGKGHPNDPDVVSTSYAVKALLAVSDLDEEFATVAETAADFLVEDLEYREVADGAKINYHMNHGDEYYTLNAGAIGARMLVDLYDRFGEEEYRERATKIFDFVVSRQTDRGGWYYRDPPEASHLSMDNHHNGFIIESLQRYREVTGSTRYDEALDRSLSFYRETLFEDDGAPNWDETSTYPRDIHAAAQGILVFTYAGNLEFARQIIEWTLDNLYAGDGRFFYRQQRYYTKPITLMRWCQAWMTYAFTEYLATVHGVKRASAGALDPDSV